MLKVKIHNDITECTIKYHSFIVFYQYLTSFGWRKKKGQGSVFHARCEGTFDYIKMYIWRELPTESVGINTGGRIHK